MERAWETSEFWFNLLAQVFSVLSFHFCWYLPLINHAVYLIFRAKVKGIEQNAVHILR